MSQQLFNLPIVLCAAASTLAYVLLTQNNATDESGSMAEDMTGGGQELTDETFKQALADAKKNKETLFIDLYAPWCGWCNKLAPVWKELAEKFEGDDIVKIMMINADDEKKAKKHFNVETFPTLVLYNGKKNKYHKYEGERTLEDFTEFIEKRG